MELFKSNNPAFNEKTIQNIALETGQEVMTVGGAMRKFGLMLVMLLGAASFTWAAYYKGANVMPWAIGSAIGGFVVAMVIIFKKICLSLKALNFIFKFSY